MERNYIGQIFGTRQIIKNYCDDADWENVSRKKPHNHRDYVLGKCLNCGAEQPILLSALIRKLPKRCSVCSGIGHQGGNAINRNAWTLYGDYAIVNIPFRDKVITSYIDIEDYETVSQRTWRVAKKKNKFYLVSGSKSKNNCIYMHQLLMDRPPIGYQIDHIDGNSLNNRRSNLRIITASDNQRFVGVRCDSQIGIRGVSCDKRYNDFVVDCSYDHQRFYFKHWKELDEAIWCRYCFEQYFGLETLKHNPLFDGCNNLSNEKKEEINNYVLSIINNRKLSV